MAAHKISNSTQRFIEIEDIVDDIVILRGGSACSIIEVGAINFTLLSADEQDAKIFTYAALLNSLSFPIQIMIRSKKFNVSSYLKLLEEERLNAKNPTFADQIGLYKDFVAELVKINTILEKKFYIIIYYSSLEQGVSGLKEQTGVAAEQSLFLLGARASLRSKTESLRSQTQRLNLRAQTLNKEQLIKLFYEIFNDASIDYQETENLVKPSSMQEGNS